MLSPVNKISVMKYAHLMRHVALLLIFLKGGFLTRDNIAGDAVPWNENALSFWTIV